MTDHDDAARTPDTEGADAQASTEAAADSAAKENPKFKWYVVHTYSGYENRAKQSLEERIKQNNLEEFFGTVLMTTE